MQTRRRATIPVANAAAEATATALLVAFWILVWWPGLLPTAAAALLAWSWSHR